MGNPKALVLLGRIQLALHGKEWAKTRALCDEALVLEGISSEEEGQLRMDLARALVNLATDSSSQEGRLSLLRQGAEEARIAVRRFKEEGGSQKHVAQCYMQLGVALCTAARLIPNDPEKTQLNWDGISSLEEACRMDPANPHYVKILTAARRAL
jgi:hypothetical protein